MISPRNARLGLTALTKRVGLNDRPDNPDGELIKYRVSFYLFLEFSSAIYSKLMKFLFAYNLVIKSFIS